VIPSGRWSALALIGTWAITFFFAMASVSLSAELSLDQLAEQYPAQVRPLLQKYCVDCHSSEKKKGDLDLVRFETAGDVRGATRVWQNVIRRLRDGEMPPEKKPQPSPDERRRMIEWSERYLSADARERAGDPGPVLLRRLTKAEYNYTIRDLTGVDLRPARKFLEDSVAGEGFANTGEALFMAPDLIPKYLDAARLVAAHAVLTPKGIRFSASNDPHDWIVEAAQEIKDFYAQYTDGKGRLPLADYIDVTLMYRDRDPSTEVALADFAVQQKLASGKKLSPKYLRLLWDALNVSQPAGEMAEIVRQWREAEVKDADDRIELPHIEAAHSSDPGDPGTFQHQPVPGAFAQPAPYGFANVSGQTVDQGFIWNPNSHFVFDFGEAREIDSVSLWSGYGDGAKGAKMQVAYATVPAGPYTVPEGGEFHYLTSIGGGVRENGSQSPDTSGYYVYEFKAATARYWQIAMVEVTAGHMPRTTSIHFGPLPDLVAPGLVGAISTRQLELWKFNGQVSYLIDSIGLFGSYLIPLVDQSGARKLDSEAYSSFARLFPPAVCFAPTIPVNNDVTVELSLREDEALSRLVLDDNEQGHLDRLWAELRYISREPVEVLYNTKQFIGFQPAVRIENTNKFVALLPSLEAKAAEFEKSVTTAEPQQLDAVVELATRAWRRPLSDAEQHELRKLYELLRDEQTLSHDAALRTLITRILVSPHYLYRIERPAAAEGDVALTDWELANRLSYFLWSSLPDDELRAAAAASQLQDKEQLAAQTRRMLQDRKSQALATEFAGQWLQFRGFDEYDGKSESQFPTFTPELRAAMNREATEFATDMIRNDRSVRNLLRADYTFLNDQLAQHYNIPGIEGTDFRRADGVSRFGRGGIVAMGSVLTKQSGALRTSPVLRGTWVVETLLGRAIPNPPDDVPQLDEDQVSKDGLTMRQVLERHRADATCSTCHAKIDPYGFALEAYDPIGRLRDADLHGNAIDARAEPQGRNAFEGLAGLQGYLLEHQDEFIKQFCRKLLGYALGRTVELSDEPLLADMQTQLKNNEYRFAAAALSIVNSRQFRRHRGRNDPRETSQ
jgi:hypothetical protein